MFSIRGKQGTEVWRLAGAWLGGGGEKVEQEKGRERRLLDLSP
jgi:hypothetical protein